MLYFGYFNVYYIIYLDYGHWHNAGTAYKCTGDSVKVNTSYSL